MHLPVYLDHAASTPVDPAVAAVMDRCLRQLPGNPSATGHAPGRAARDAIESARGHVAALIHAVPEEVIWTSGATEAVNLALQGTARFLASRGRHIVTSLTEHPAGLATCRDLERHGWRVTWLSPDRDGLITTAAVEQAIGPDTVLVSLMHVNNETGVRQDLAALGELCRRRDVLLHVDAAQSAGREPLDVQAHRVDLLSLSAHKIYGPKGVGALFLNRDRLRRIEPVLHGGGQERGMRPGTLPTHQIAGMGEAFRLAVGRRAAEASHTAALRDRLWAGIRDVPGIVLNGHPERRAPHILNVSVPGVEGESLFLALRDLAIASGSACTSTRVEPSHVLRALGRPAALAESSVRFSVGRQTTVGEIDFAVQAFTRSVARLRRFSPVQAPADSCRHER